MKALDKFKKAFERFKKESLRGAVDSSTKAALRGDHYVVELFSDGPYKISWSNNVGSLYFSRGLSVGIPILHGDDDNAIAELRYYDNAIAALDEKFAEACENYDENDQD
jgi:hypothetical protein